MQARELLDDLKVKDVKLIVARKGADCPTGEEVEILKAHQGAEAAACQIDRKYRKSVEPFVSFCCEPKKFRFHDQLLREWLVPKAAIEPTYGRPSDAFREAATRAPLLILHSDALLSADELAEHRWKFATLASNLLERYAKGEKLAPPREWKAAYGVDFAANGRVSFKLTPRSGAAPLVCFWHLKEGDNTSRQSAARVYFARIEFEARVWVIVFYVGPHPDDGEYSVEVTLV